MSVVYPRCRCLTPDTAEWRELQQLVEEAVRNDVDPIRSDHALQSLAADAYAAKTLGKLNEFLARLDPKS